MVSPHNHELTTFIETKTQIKTNESKTQKQLIYVQVRKLKTTYEK